MLIITKIPKGAIKSLPFGHHRGNKALIVLSSFLSTNYKNVRTDTVDTKRSAPASNPVNSKAIIYEYTNSVIRMYLYYYLYINKYLINY